MPLPNLQPKDALVLCTVTVLFIYFAFILRTNYEIVLPFWTPLFWAAALSVPLHALKTTLLPILHEAFENDILDIIASTIGAIATFILRFFLGRYIACAIKAVFLGYCYVVYMLCDGRPRNTNKNTLKENAVSSDKKEKEPSENGYRRQFQDGDQEMDTLQHDDFELHPDYQTLVDQEPDDYARAPNWPSYLNLLRGAFIYVLLQLGTPAELWTFAKAVWSETQIGTPRQLNILMVLVLLHVQYSCLGQIVAMIERVVYPNLTVEQQKERSIINTVPRMIRKAMQESLNSTLTTVIVLSMLAVVGALSGILSVGVAHDIQGLVAQTHVRVTHVRQEQMRQDFDGGYDAEYLSKQKQSLVSQMDEALSQAYDAGIGWFDPILKEAFPDLAWGATDWASQVAHVVVDLDSQPTTSFVPLTKGTCEVPSKIESNSDELFQPYLTTQSPLEGDEVSSEPSVPDTVDSADVEGALHEPEIWVIPTLESMGLPQIKLGNKEGFAAQVQKQRNRAINISQAKYLLSILLGYKGFDTPTMLYGFNVFNDLLFRWILFVLGLMTFTGLKVSPLQRIGWIIDQALISAPASFGSFQLSTSASPGRVLAKSLEFSISGTFLSMFKLSIYHTLFTLAWTHFLTDRVMALAAIGEASSDFVDIKYAWLTSFFGIVLTIFPIAPNWVVAIPGALVHFYIYGQRPLEAGLMLLGHLLLTMFVDGPVWDSHVVKTARPGVSSAFWLGLWIFLGGMKWGTKGLLVGPVLYAAVPSIWSALLELRGKPSRQVEKMKRRSAFTETGIPFDEYVERAVVDEDQEYYSHRSSRASSVNGNRSRTGRKVTNGFRR